MAKTQTQASPPTLTFDAETHAYHLGARRLISVTQCLRLAGLVDPRWYTEYGRLRGTYVHQMTEAFDRGRLVEETLDERLRPYLDAYRQFLAESGFRWTAIEHRLSDQTDDAPLGVEGLAGTVDRLGVTERSGDAWIVDLKSGAPEPWHAVQLAGYSELVKLRTSRPLIKKAGLYLTSNGKYKFEEYNDRKYAATWRAAVVVAQFRVAHKVGDWKECLGLDDQLDPAVYDTA